MPKVVDHDDMRKRLLDTAGEMFAARGYAATGMRDLAAAAGVSTGSLYHYFPDKRALFEQLVERTVEADLADLEETLDSLPRSTSARLDAFLKLVRESEDVLQLQSAVLVEYARLARTERGVSLAPSRAAHVRYAAALARLLGQSPQQIELARTEPEPAVAHMAIAVEQIKRHIARLAEPRDQRVAVRKQAVGTSRVHSNPPARME
jgi:AcrR family transcriptional regulator